MYTGQVLVEDITRNNSAAFIRFLRQLDQAIDAGLTIHLVLDNGSSHVAKATRTPRARGSCMWRRRPGLRCRSLWTCWDPTSANACSVGLRRGWSRSRCGSRTMACRRRSVGGKTRSGTPTSASLTFGPTSRQRN
ncbi:hypothetical protein [Streptomyces sp. NPDC059649]|uniref:hypothetical protein n=1 Tax=Streptomyces sp. NPDC059649 TaxID=3346895 RepID=UPI0036A292C4